MSHPQRHPRRPSTSRPLANRHRVAGFSFIEILVVMGIIAVLVGIGIGVYVIAFRKTPIFKTQALVASLSTQIAQWHSQYRAYPPGDLTRVTLATGLPIKVAKLPNTTNMGIESVYQCLSLPGVNNGLTISESDASNYDGDALDKAVASNGNATLYEIRDAWGNPLVYFEDRDYVQAEKDPPTYINGSGPGSEEPGDAVHPKPWRLATGGFAQPGRFQLFSMGEDGIPNTDDDIKSW